MTNKLKALKILLLHDTMEYNKWAEQLLFFEEAELKKAMEIVEDLDEETFLDIQEKLLDYSNSLESSYEDGEVVFPPGHRYKNEMFGFQFVGYEPSYAEEDFFEKIEKINYICLN
jgi:hypothetical protein